MSYKFEFFCIFCGKPEDPKGPTSCPECREKLKAKQEAAQPQ